MTARRTPSQRQSWWASLRATPAGRMLRTHQNLRVPWRSVAEQLRKHGERPLAGDEAIYGEVMELRRRYTEQFTRLDQ